MLTRIIKRIIDGVLFFPVAVITTMVLPMLINNSTIKNFFYSINNLYLFIGIMVVSIGIGVFQKLKGYDEKKYNAPKGGVIFSIIKSIVFVTIAFWVMPHIQGDSAKLSRVLLLVWLYFFAMLVQMAFLGKRSVMGKLFSFVWAKIRAVLLKFLGAIGTVIGWIEDIADLLGPRLVTAIGELIVLVSVCALILNTSDALAVHADKEYQVAEVVEEYAEFLSIKDFTCPREGIVGAIMGIEISGFLYVILITLPGAGMFAGVICFVVGIGRIGQGSRKLIGWQHSLWEKWETRMPKLRMRLENGDIIEINGNPHGYLTLLWFALLSIANGFVGMLMPVFIILNTLVGIVPFVIEGIARLTIDKRKELER